MCLKTVKYNNEKYVGMAVLIPHKIRFRSKNIYSDKEKC